ncbi:hypothetical protein GCM10010383_48760 [Streptomyces lomondensis]|uniref:Uncharacterized protein n=1 Tax=Streptomyces lomondensis TaxID=68229 RepID=A0ABQ2XED1_9ACTN|nr:hypothetical protein GCM10010383_48760 [Streptomyces lomondensis]
MGGMLPASQTGRDGRPPVPTELAAYSLGMRPKQFRDRARRRVRGRCAATWETSTAP